MNKPGEQTQDDLNALWQAQPVSTLDVNYIVKRARTQRTKQRFYMCLDVLSMFPIFVYVYMDIDLPITLHIFVLLSGGLGVLTILYFAKLRWHGMFQNSLDTGQYTHMLYRQLHNNAQIAYFNKHCGWVMVVAMLAAFFLNGVFTQAPAESIIKDMLKALAFGMAMMVPWVIWAHRREKRFRKEAEQLRRHIEENNL